MKPEANDNLRKFHQNKSKKRWDSQQTIVGPASLTNMTDKHLPADLSHTSVDGRIEKSSARVSRVHTHYAILLCIIHEYMHKVCIHAYFIQSKKKINVWKRSKNKFDFNYGIYFY